MNPTYELSGKVDVSLNGITVPAHFIGEEGVTTTLTEVVREITTMAGTFRQNTGIYEESSVAFQLVLPNFNYLGNILPDLYTASTDRPTVAGQVVIGGDTCTVRSNTGLVVHYTCQPNSDNDIYLPNASVVASMEIVQNATDPVVVTVTANAQPDENGVIAILGTGSLTEPTLWDAEAEQYVAAGSS